MRSNRSLHRRRLLATQAGDIELKIQKLSHGSFFPSLLSPRRRIDQALHAVIMQAYVEGVSTRRTATRPRRPSRRARAVDVGARAVDGPAGDVEGEALACEGCEGLLLA